MLDELVGALQGLPEPTGRIATPAPAGRRRLPALLLLALLALGAAGQQQVVQQFRGIALEFAAKQVRGGLVSAARGQALAGGLDGLRTLVVDALDPRTLFEK